ncbi:hypothetical protein TNCV_1507761 [Trichonephila clavipes]|nr:hypothetical protein TNCV_1507761 [Trichonephila clavipes]
MSKSPDRYLSHPFQRSTGAESGMDLCSCIWTSLSMKSAIYRLLKERQTHAKVQCQKVNKDAFRANVTYTLNDFRSIGPW